MPLIPLLFLSTTRILGVLAEAPLEPADEFGSPMLAVFALIAICVVFMLVGVGIAIALIMAAAVAILTGLGILSSSVLVGLSKRRLSSGVRALHYQVCAVLGIPAGIGILWLGSWLSHSPLALREILTIGSIAGMFAGLLLAYLFDLAARTIYRRWIEPHIGAELTNSKAP